MIERFIKNDLTLKRWQRFRSDKMALASLWLIIVISFFSFTAEFWSNSKPIVMKHKGELYFPVVKDYHPSEFGQEDVMVTDYRKLEIDGWAVWPLIKWDPFESNNTVERFPSPPTNDNILGTDDRGRDILSRLLYGFRYSVTFAIMCWILEFIIGVILGGIMGYAGGKTDLIGQRLVEIFSTIPQFFLLIIVISIFQPNLWLLIVLSAAFGWIFISYYIRGEFLKLRNREYVEAAKALGASHARLIFKHILPNSLGPIFTFSPFVIAGNIAALASLDFLGFGLPQPTPSWGELLAESQKNFTIAWWLATWPSLVLFCTLVLFGLIGEGVRDAYDPKK